ncbi:MAG: hypothetical protein GVY29_08080 [Spirochaetes bacterium]|nr:hypothetical protein [Spirochaetota bacterium]
MKHIVRLAVTLALVGASLVACTSAPQTTEPTVREGDGDDRGPRLMKDLSSAELADYAQAGYIAFDFNPLTARLLFHGLLEDPNHIELLQTMADALVEDSPALSAVVFEYLYAAELGMSEEQRATLDTMYSSAMWVWDLSRKTDGSQEIESEDFQNPSLFTYDEEGYRELFADFVAEAGSIERAVRGVQVVIGLYGAFLQHRNGPDYEFDRSEIFGHQRFAIQPEYGAWLNRPVEEELGMLEPVE